MLSITIEMWPCGDWIHRRIVDQLVIINDGTGDGKTANYTVRFQDGGGEPVKKFRRGNKSAMSLLKKALNARKDL